MRLYLFTAKNLNVNKFKNLKKLFLSRAFSAFNLLPIVHRSATRSPARGLKMVGKKIF
jgi:hypothetical protein